MESTISETLQCTDNIEVRVKRVAKHLMAMQSGDDVWPGKVLLDRAITKSVHFLDAHLETLSGQLALFQREDGGKLSPDEAAHKIETVFLSWNTSANSPSLLSITLTAMDYLGIKPDPDDFNMTVVASILGEVESTLSYHNNLHFRKVLVQLVRLIKTNNEIYNGTSRSLNTKDICLLLTAASIHDLGHDGKGNTIKGLHLPGRAEKYSMDLAKPYLEMAGCDDKTLQELCVMLLTTDVSPIDDPTNPMMQMKAAYHAHFGEGDGRSDKLNLSEDLEVLETDPRLSTLCLLLHEADIATSAGVSYTVTKNETLLLMKEQKDDKAYPSQIVEFLNRVCRRKFLSDAGQKLYAANMARIYALAEEDLKNGNQPFTSAESPDVNIESVSESGAGDETPQTLN